MPHDAGVAAIEVRQRTRTIAVDDEAVLSRPAEAIFAPR
jgi:hypothetical protein